MRRTRTSGPRNEATAQALSGRDDKSRGADVTDASATAHATGAGRQLLTAEDQQKVVQAINAKTNGQGPGPCSVCRTNSWQLQDGIYVVPAVAAHNLTPVALAPAVYPMVAISCVNCGNTHFLSIVYLGISDLLPRPPA